MKIGMLVVSVIGLSLLSSARGDDLPRMGYAPETSVEDLVARGYRWATVNGPYACASQQNLRVITTRRTDLTELRLVTDGDAYYLIPGTLVRVVRDDDANGMSQILLGGVIRPLWTYPKFLTVRPIRDIYGIVETPDKAGLVDPSDAVGKELRTQGPTTASRIPTTPRTLQEGIKLNQQNANQ